MLIWLKKSTAAEGPGRGEPNLPASTAQQHDDALLTASHSLRSSPSGRRTAMRRLPDPSLRVRFDG